MRGIVKCKASRLNAGGKAGARLQQRQDRLGVFREIVPQLCGGWNLRRAVICGFTLGGNWLPLRLLEQRTGMACFHPVSGFAQISQQPRRLVFTCCDNHQGGMISRRVGGPAHTVLPFRVRNALSRPGYYQNPKMQANLPCGIQRMVRDCEDSTGVSRFPTGEKTKPGRRRSWNLRTNRRSASAGLPPADTAPR